PVRQLEEHLVGADVRGRLHQRLPPAASRGARTEGCVGRARMDRRGEAYAIRGCTLRSVLVKAPTAPGPGPRRRRSRTVPEQRPSPRSAGRTTEAPMAPSSYMAAGCRGAWRSGAAPVSSPSHDPTEGGSSLRHHRLAGRLLHERPMRTSWTRPGMMMAVACLCVGCKGAGAAIELAAAVTT